MKVLKLERNQLGGALPVALLALPEIVELRLGNNQFSGELPRIPAAAADDPHKLEILDLNYNGLSGALPPSLGNLGNLTELRLWGSDLSGPIPPQIGELSRLRSLSLGHNRLSGELPEELAELSNLTSLNLSSNDFSGPIPPRLGELSRLKKMLLGSNRFDGSIPPQLGDLRALGLLLLGSNRLTGEFPSELAGLDRLTGLDLVHNNVTGCVPNALNRDTTMVAFNTGLGFCGASLSALSVTPAQLDVPFDPDVLTYTATTTSDTDQVTLIATPTGSAATIDYLDTNGDPIADADNETEGHQFTLTETETTVQVKVDTPGAESKTYTLSIYRPPELSISASTVSEGDATATLMVRMNGRSSRPVTVAYRTVDGTAVAGLDYTTSTGTVTFAPSDELEQTRDVTVEILDDIIHEPDESFTVQLREPVHDRVVDAATVTIIDNDPRPVVSIAGLNVPVDEGDATATLTVRMEGRSSRPVTVAYRTADGTAVAGLDYTTSTGTVTFAPSDDDVQNQQVTVPIIDDIIHEPDESFTLQLIDADKARINPDKALGTVTIIDNDPPDVVVSIAERTVAEAAGVVAFEVELSDPAPAAVSVVVSTVGVTAVAGSDFVDIGDVVVSFAQGQEVATVSVEIINDTDDDDGEWFNLVLSAPLGVVVEDPAAKVTIADDDPLELSVNAVEASVHEGTAAQFEVTLNVAAVEGSPVSVNYSVAADSIEIKDLNVADREGMVTFAAGEKSKLVTVRTVNDVVHEDNETFRLVLSDPRGAEIGVVEASLTILDNDPQPVLSAVRNVRFLEGSGDGTVVVPLRRSGPTEQEIRVKYRIFDGRTSSRSQLVNATEDADFVAATGTLVIAPGDQAQVEATVLNDVFDEPREVFVVELFDAENAALRDTRSFVFITDDDDPPNLLVSDIQVREGAGHARFDVELPVVSEKEVTVNYRTLGVTAVQGVDFTATSGTLVFAPRAEKMTVRVPIVDDPLVEDDETFTLTLSEPVNAVIAAADATATAVITDNDVPQVSIADVRVSESTGSVELTVRLDRTSDQPIIVDYRTVEDVGDTARGGLDSLGDYVTAQGRVEIPAGGETATFTLTVNNDLLDEHDETFTVELSLTDNPESASFEFGDSTALVYIEDDDDPPGVSIAAMSATEGRPAELVVTLGVASGKDIVVQITTSDRDSATEHNAGSDSDYTAQSQSVTIPAGQDQTTLNITTTHDLIDEHDETFNAAITSAENATYSTAPVPITILDNDDPPLASILVPAEGINGDEGTTLTIEVKLAQPSGKTVTIDYTTGDLFTATAGDDYITAGGTLAFLPGTTKMTVTVRLLDDEEVEGEEFFYLELTDSTNATLNFDGSFVDITINDTDDTD